MFVFVSGFQFLLAGKTRTCKQTDGTLEVDFPNIFPTKVDVHKIRSLSYTVTLQYSTVMLRPTPVSAARIAHWISHQKESPNSAPICAPIYASISPSKYCTVCLPILRSNPRLKIAFPWFLPFWKFRKSRKSRKSWKYKQAFKTAHSNSFPRKPSSALILHGNLWQKQLFPIWSVTLWIIRIT